MQSTELCDGLIKPGANFLRFSDVDRFVVDLNIGRGLLDRGKDFFESLLPDVGNGDGGTTRGQKVSL